MRITIEMSFFLHHQLRGNNGKVNVASYPHHTVDMESAINKFRH